MSNKNIHIFIIFIIIAFVVYFGFFKNNNIQNYKENEIKVLNKIKTLENKNDSLEELNKKDKNEIDKIHKNILTIDSVVNNATVDSLQKLLYKNIYGK